MKINDGNNGCGSSASNGGGESGRSIAASFIESLADYLDHCKGLHSSESLLRPNATRSKPMTDGVLTGESGKCFSYKLAAKTSYNHAAKALPHLQKGSQV